MKSKITEGMASENFVVRELIAYHKKYDTDPVYQRKMREVWQVEAKGRSPYAGAYKEALKQLGGVVH